MNAKQLRFFYNEVMGLFDWSEEDEAVGIDPLDYIRAELKRLRNKPLICQYSDLKVAAEKMAEQLRAIRSDPASDFNSDDTAALEAYEAWK